MVKNKYTLFFIFLAFVGNSFSQSIAIGIFTGPSATWLWTTGLAPKNTDLNYAVGFTGEVTFAKDFSLLLKPCLEVKGNSIDFKFGPPVGTITDKTKLSYFTLPLFLSAKIGNKSKFVFSAGPYFSYLFSAKEVIPGNSLPFNSAGTIGVLFQKFDAGAAFCIGGEFPLTQRTRLTLALSEELGLYNINKFRMKGTERRNNALALLFGLTYSLGETRDQLH